MDYSPSDLYSEIRQIIQDRAEAGVITNRAWLVTHVLKVHPIKRHTTFDPDDFSLICRQLAVSRAVDQALARLKHQDEGGDPDAAEFNIPLLPGFKHLRKVYPIKRKDGIDLVPIDQLSDDEIAAKVRTYEKASIAFNEHANELIRYRAARDRRPAA